MKISKEVKIGISSLVILLITYWGITFLKGANILSSTNIYHTSYVNVDGLEVSSPVLINGMKVGTVLNVGMNDVRGVVNVDFSVKTKYKIPSNSKVLLGGQSLLGGKDLTIEIGSSELYLKGGDTIKSMVNGSITDVATDMATKVSYLIDSLALTISKINMLLDERMISDVQQTMSNLNQGSATLTSMLNSEKGRIATITTNLAKVSGELNGIMPEIKGAVSNINSLTDTLNTTLPIILKQIDEVITKINSEKGTVGKLLTNTDLYDKATITMDEAAALLKDLKENPKRYVHFSIFGKKDKTQNK